MYAAQAALFIIQNYFAYFSFSEHAKIGATLYTMLTQLQAWWDFLNDAQAITTWHRDHAEIPIIAVSLYLVFIFGVPSLMKNRKEFNLKTAFTIWNLLLSSKCNPFSLLMFSLQLFWILSFGPSLI